MSHRSVLAALVLWLCTTVAACADDPTESVHLDVYKTPTCGCCTLWMDHLAESGFTTTGHHPEDIGTFKQERGVPLRYGSCHTAISGEGYVFEGHVPARFITQFLDNPPEGAIGLTVPAMPLGSPGMEYQNMFQPYQVLLLKPDGEVETYASVESYEQQF